jgi:hypothetical protein
VLYGREAERAVLAELLDAARESRSGALVLRGEPGMGKTALLADVRKRDGDDRFLISAACLTLIAELAERRPDRKGSGSADVAGGVEDQVGRVCRPGLFGPAHVRLG